MASLRLTAMITVHFQDLKAAVSAAQMRISERE